MKKLIFSIQILLLISCNASEQNTTKQENVDTILVSDKIKYPQKNNLVLNGYWICTQTQSFIENNLQGEELSKAKQFKNTKVIYIENDSLFMGFQCRLKYSFSNTLLRAVFKHSYELDDYKKRILDKFNIKLEDSIGVIRNYQGLPQSCELLDQNIYFIQNKLILENEGVLYLFEKQQNGYEAILSAKDKLKFPITFDYLENEAKSNSSSLYSLELNPFGLCGDLEYFIVSFENSDIGVFIFKSYCGDDFTYTLVTIKESKVISQIELAGILFEENDNTKQLKRFEIKSDRSLLIKEEIYINDTLSTSKNHSYTINKDGTIK